MVIGVVLARLCGGYRRGFSVVTSRRRHRRSPAAFASRRHPAYAAAAANWGCNPVKSINTRYINTTDWFIFYYFLKHTHKHTHTHIPVPVCIIQ